MRRPSNEEKSFIPKSRLKKAKLGHKPFLLNPSTLTDVVTMNYNGVQGANRKYPIPVFSGSNLREISFEALVTENMEGVEKGYVLDFIRHVHKFTSVTASDKDAFYRALGWSYIGSITSEKLSSHGQPKQATLGWGSLWYRGYISNLEVNYTEFSNKLEPIEATINITMVCKQLFKD